MGRRDSQALDVRRMSMSLRGSLVVHVVDVGGSESAAARIDRAAAPRAAAATSWQGWCWIRRTRGRSVLHAAAGNVWLEAGDRPHVDSAIQQIVATENAIGS
jgi:hypothetical protein